MSAGFSTGEHDATDLVKVGDLTVYPELMWLHRLELLPAVVLAVLCFLVAGWSGLVVGFLWSTVLVYHATFCINSLAHVHGRKRYVTGDDSRNNWLLALFTLGEGWHNNHHAYQSSVRQGFRWWEIDVTYYVLKIAVLVRHRLEHEGAARTGAAQRAAARRTGHQSGGPPSSPDGSTRTRLAHAISSALHRADLAQLQLPTLHDILNRAA